MMQFNRRNYTDDFLIELYKKLIKPRLVEEKMLILLRQGKISKWFSGIGQEAIAVGATTAMENEDYILPLHRNLGVFTSRNIPLHRLFAQWQGKPSGFTKGRDRSFHFGTNEHHIVGMISHLGAQLSVADGIALANKLERKKEVTLAFSGEGGTSEGEFHEALNVAAVWELPVIFVIENNGYGLSTPTSEQYRCKQLIDKAIGYGMESIQIDGNNLLEVYHTINHFADDIRLQNRPILVEALTFRMRGHEEASGTKYVPEKLMEAWAKKDPVQNYENYLLQEGVLTDKMREDFREFIKKEIDEAWHQTQAETWAVADEKQELGDVYFPYVSTEMPPLSEGKSKKRFIDAISDGLRQSMEKYPQSILMGQDVAEYGGVFKVSLGFVDIFGKNRIRNTPICESAIIGSGLGLSVKGWKAIIEMQFADFVSCGFNQIVNNLAKIHYRWGQNADVVIRMPTGAGVGAGPFHSQSNEAWFFHTPGLQILYPSNPYDAKGLLNAAIANPNPVLFFEHKALYRSLEAEIPNDYYTLEIGKAKTVLEGEDVLIISYGLGVHWAKQVVEQQNLLGQVCVLDLVSLLPWDKNLVKSLVEKIGKVLLLQEDTHTGGIMAEIAAWISENCFEFLDAPIRRVSSLDTPVPFAKHLEQNFLATARLEKTLQALVDY